MPNDVALIGLAVMGRNLVLNMERNGFSVAVFNRTYAVTEEFLAGEAGGKKISGFKTLESLIASLQRPRKIILMVKAGPAVDEILNQLIPFLEKDDILIDAGNSFYRDTESRVSRLAERGIHFFGMGVSGGEEGALWGPSMMPGGDKGAYELLAPILEKISAEADSGRCFTYVGRGGAGHFVKMVHNGIEYADMQLIAEIYDLMRRSFGMNPLEISEIFSQWNKGPLQSYLIEITAEILKFRETPESPFLVDLILDKAGQKGTGGWTVQTALEEGIPIPTICAAVDARTLSSQKKERLFAAKKYQNLLLLKSKAERPGKEWMEKLMRTLYAAKICAYAQGFGLMSAVNKNHGFGIDLAEIARIWKGGCIIRAAFLDRIQKAYDADTALLNLITASGFQDDLTPSASAWQDVLNFSLRHGIAVPALSASWNYFLSSVTENLPMNLIQAQRDYFGAHTYERKDKPGSFHTRWKR
ncbi:MAG: NADP-dependent phosphogluconate dehydrogenase [Candidatus Omnitrophica bacterium]|nr:NADP-dependent phosphogluconate dehydrogenase [Candidatus Omnitrophota bacterium]